MPTTTWERVIAWRLARGNLLQRLAGTRLDDCLESMCGAHAQILSSVGLALCARAHGVTREGIDRALWERRTLVKTWAMRGTLHVFTAADLPVYCAALRAENSYLDPDFLRFLELNAADVEAVMDAVPQALDGGPLTREELAAEVVRITRRKHLDEHLRSGWGPLLKPVAYEGRLCFGPNRGRHVTFARPDRWLPEWHEVTTADALHTILRRFLSAYGPATIVEIGRWLGFKPVTVRRACDGLGDEISAVEIEGTEAVGLTSELGSVRANRKVDGVRLLPSFDQFLVVVAPHSQALVDGQLKGRVFKQRTAVWSLPVVLVNGKAGGTWKHESKGKRVIVRVEPFIRLTRPARQMLDDEVERLGTYFGVGAELELARP